MQRTQFCRRTFLAGMTASAAIVGLQGRAAAQIATRADFAPHYQALLARFAAAHPELIHDFRVITLAGTEKPWRDTELTLTEGDEVSLLASGKVYLSRAADLWLLPRVVLWARVGDADVFRPGSETYSFRSTSAGRLRLATLQGRWSTPQGEHAAPSAYAAIEGAIDILVIRWGKQGAAKGLASLAAFAGADGLLARACGRLGAPVALPRGFEELWYAGSGHNFAETVIEAAPAIALRSELNGGIIRAPLDLPLESGVRLEWEWRINQLPSLRAEDLAPFHQYASLAVEFDDGQDLSWYWSAAIAAEKHYRCPFPSWPGETHLVVRSGAAGQGSWLRETREVAADVATALSRRPERLKGVWLIASTMFGARAASVDFRSIAVVDAAGQRHAIFPT